MQIMKVFGTVDISRHVLCTYHDHCWYCEYFNREMDKWICPHSPELPNSHPCTGATHHTRILRAVTTPKTGTTRVTTDTSRAPWQGVSQRQCNTCKASKHNRQWALDTINMCGHRKMARFLMVKNAWNTYSIWWIVVLLHNNLSKSSIKFY